LRELLAALKGETRGAFVGEFLEVLTGGLVQHLLSPLLGWLLEGLLGGIVTGVSLEVFWGTLRESLPQNQEELRENPRQLLGMLLEDVVKELLPGLLATSGAGGPT